VGLPFLNMHTNPQYPRHGSEVGSRDAKQLISMAIVLYHVCKSTFAGYNAVVDVLVQNNNYQLIKRWLVLVVDPSLHT
jgi:hypothetical protein